MPSITLQNNEDSRLKSGDNTDYNPAMNGTGDTAPFIQQPHRIGQFSDFHSATGDTERVVFESAFRFNITSIPADAVISRVVFSYVCGSSNSGYSSWTLELREHDWGTSYSTADWLRANTFKGKPLLATNFISSNNSSNTGTKSVDGTQALIDSLQTKIANGTTYLYCICGSSRYGIDNGEGDRNTYITLSSSYTSTQLVVYYTQPGVPGDIIAETNHESNNSDGSTNYITVRDGNSITQSSTLTVGESYAGVNYESWQSYEQFDLNVIPADAIIKSVEYIVDIDGVPLIAPDVNFNVYIAEYDWITDVSNDWRTKLQLQALIDADKAVVLQNTSTMVETVGVALTPTANFKREVQKVLNGTTATSGFFRVIIFSGDALNDTVTPTADNTIIFDHNNDTYSKLRITWDYPTPGLVLDLGSFF